MAAFQEFLTGLLEEGRIVFRTAQAPSDRPAERDVAALAEAFQVAALEVTGPPVAFDPRIAAAAAELVRQASWALISHAEPLATLKKRLVLSGPPSTPSQHLSADLLLRYLPQVLQRARGVDAADPLVDLLAQVLRQWPLSGVLADLEDGPLLPLDFGGHPGLCLLYAERLAANDRPAWRPGPASPAQEPYELVLAERSAPAVAPPSRPPPSEPTRHVGPPNSRLTPPIR